MKIFTFLLLAFTSAAWAEEIPECALKTQGAVQCMAGRMCECKFFEKSATSTALPGFRWDCGITRPACLNFEQIEQTKPYDGPNSVEINN